LNKNCEVKRDVSRHLRAEKYIKIIKKINIVKSIQLKEQKMKRRMDVPLNKLVEIGNI
jgi:hypothetical protein